MERKEKRTVLKGWFLFGVKAGLAWALIDFLVFFGFFPSLRESTRELLGVWMKPLLLSTPLGVAGVCLIGWLLTLFAGGSNHRD